MCHKRTFAGALADLRVCNRTHQGGRPCEINCLLAMGGRRLLSQAGRAPTEIVGFGSPAFPESAPLVTRLKMARSSGSM